jgi:hypothetical protein
MKPRIAVFVLFCLAALTFTSGAHAQFPRGARGVTGTVWSIEGTGTVTEISAASLTITFPLTGDFATFAITAETEFFGGRPAAGDDVTLFYRRDGEQNIATRVVLEITV